jgi:hypothetical protein
MHYRLSSSVEGYVCVFNDTFDLYMYVDDSIRVYEGGENFDKINVCDLVKFCFYDL